MCIFKKESDKGITKINDKLLKPCCKGLKDLQRYFYFTQLYSFKFLKRNLEKNIYKYALLENTSLFFKC